VKKRRILRSERGFTLVELGIVMAIIAILAAVAYPTYKGMRTRAYISEAKAALQEARVEVWATYVQYEKWPGAAGVPGYTTHTAGNWEISGAAITSGDDAGDYLLTAKGIADAPAELATKTVTLQLDTTGGTTWGGSATP